MIIYIYMFKRGFDGLFPEVMQFKMNLPIYTLHETGARSGHINSSGLFGLLPAEMMTTSTVEGGSVLVSVVSGRRNV